MTRSAEIIARDTQRLVGVHPDMAAALEKILAAMDALGFAMTVTEGVRSTERQWTLYQQGRTTPGPIVTQLDGHVKRSKHQVNADGLGHAVDCAFLDDPLTTRVETYDPAQPWDLYGRMGEALGLTWGGRWTSPHDMPHLERRT